MGVKELFKNPYLREWINTSVAVIGLVFLFWGMLEIHEININLKEIKAERVTANEIYADLVSTNIIQNVTNITFTSGGIIASST